MFVRYVQAHMNDPQILSYLEAAVEARMEIRDHVPGNRDMMYLDLALEEQIRKAAERGAGISGMHCHKRCPSHFCSTRFGCCWSDHTAASESLSLSWGQ